MGIAIVDDRASGGALKESRTSTCVHCNSIIVYKSKPIGGFLRGVRTSLHPVYGRIEEIGTGFYCHRHNGDICKYCGDAVFKSIGNCVSMEQRAEATVTAIAHGVPIYSREGREYIQNLVAKRIY